MMAPRSIVIILHSQYLEMRGCISFHSFQYSIVRTAVLDRFPAICIPFLLLSLDTAFTLSRPLTRQIACMPFKIMLQSRSGLICSGSFRMMMHVFEILELVDFFRWSYFGCSLSFSISAEPPPPVIFNACNSFFFHFQPSTSFFQQEAVAPPSSMIVTILFSARSWGSKGSRTAIDLCFSWNHLSSSSSAIFFFCGLVRILFYKKERKNETKFNRMRHPKAPSTIALLLNFNFGGAMSHRFDRFESTPFAPFHVRKPTLTVLANFCDHNQKLLFASWFYPRDIACRSSFFALHMQNRPASFASFIIINTFTLLHLFNFLFLSFLIIIVGVRLNVCTAHSK